jgi:EmrB/QacA subfamily drug resistance transporter
LSVSGPGIQARPTETAKRLLPWLVAVGLFMESLDTTILNTAVPTIAHALKVPPLSMKAVLASYTLSLAVFIPISGWMANRFGTRRVFASAIGTFTLGSLLCGISSDIHWLVAFRILQGCGGAMMLPVGRLTMVRTFAKSELIRAMSFVSIPALVAPMVGPLAGGVIIHYFHWSVIFFVNIPIGLVGLMLVYRHMPNYRARKNYPLDVVGLILFGSGVALLSYVLEVFGEHSLSGREIGGLLVLSFALIGAYWLHGSRTRHPLLRLGLLRIRSFRVSVTGNLCTRLGIGGLPFLLPLLYQVGLGYTAIQSGPADHAAGAGGHEPEADAAANPEKVRLPQGLDIQHRDARSDADSLFGNRRRLARVGHRADGIHLRLLHVDAVHQHEHPGLCRRE